MKLRITLICALAILISCKKKNEPEPVSEEVPAAPVQTPANYLPAKKGDYWIYQTVWVEEDGTETINLYNDSVVAENDTIIRGRIFRAFVTYNHNNAKMVIKFRADSLHYIISEDEILFSSVDTTHFLQERYYLNSVTDTFASVRTKMAPEEKNFTVPAGTFKVKDAIGICYTWPKHLQTGFVNPRFRHCRFAPGIGMIQESLIFSATMAFQEKRLLRYKVQ